ASQSGASLYPAQGDPAQGGRSIKRAPFNMSRAGWVLPVAYTRAAHPRQQHYREQFASDGDRFLESTHPTRSPLRPGKVTWHQGFLQAPASLMQPLWGSNACTTVASAEGLSCTLRLSPSATPVTCQYAGRCARLRWARGCSGSMPWREGSYEASAGSAAR